MGCVICGKRTAGNDLCPQCEEQQQLADDEYYREQAEAQRADYQRMLDDQAAAQHGQDSMEANQ